MSNKFWDDDASYITIHKKTPDKGVQEQEKKEPDKYVEQE